MARKADPTVPDGYVEFLPEPCNVAVEIGSKTGPWAVRFLSHTKQPKLFCVDPWEIDNDNDLPEDVGASSHTFYTWLNNLSPWLYDRVWPLRGKSEDIAQHFVLPVDFLMIDGDHRPQGVYTDLKLWVPKVTNGGLVVGHDWTGKWGSQVQKGVKRWLEEQSSPPTIGVDRLVQSKALCFWFRK